jgi:hypothetical protein
MNGCARAPSLLNGLLGVSVLPSRDRDDAAVAARNADSEEKFSDTAAGALDGVLDAGLT